MPDINQDKVKTVNKFPIAVTAVVFISFCGILLNYIINSRDQTTIENCKQCLNEVSYLRKRVETLEKRDSTNQEELKSYVRALFLKDTQIKKQANMLNAIGSEG